MASIAWLDKVQKGADSSVAVFGQAASMAQSVGKATEEKQTHGDLLEFAKYMKENKWERSREPPTGRN